VVPAAPGIFSANVSGPRTGSGLQQRPDRELGNRTRRLRGTPIVLFLTGEGQTNPPGVDGQITASVIPPAQPVSVSFGNVPAAITRSLGKPRG